MTTDLIAMLRTFDGKHVAPFQEAAAMLPAEVATLEWLCDIAQTEETAVEVGATWLIKHFLEQGLAANEAVAQKIIGRLATVQQPDGILHLLQSLPFLTIPPTAETQLYAALQQHLATQKHKFVRAWCYSGLGQLAKQNEDYRAEVLALFDTAQAQEAASVQVRLRKARQLLVPYQ